MSRPILSLNPVRDNVTENWNWARISKLVLQTQERAGNEHELPVLSVTKYRGIVRASDYFKKMVHGQDTSNYKLVRRGEFAYATIHLDEGSIGLLESETAGIVSPMYTTFRLAVCIDPKYLLAVLKSPESMQVYRRLVEGTVNRRGAISFERLGTLYLLHPPFQEQRKIAAILSSIDDVIETTQTVIDQLHVVKKAMMAELLTRGLPGRHTRFKQTEIGEVPCDWSIRRIGDILEETAYGTSAKCDVSSGGTPVLRIPNVVRGRVTFEDLKYAQLSSTEIRSYELREGDILIVRTNGNPEYVGRSAVVPSLSGTWLYASYLIRLRVKPDIIVPEFLHEAIRSSNVRKTMIGSIRTSAGNYNLNTEGIKSTVVPMPSIAEQKEITSVVRGLEERADAEEGKVDGLRVMKAALSSALLTGEVRVTPDGASP